MATNQVTQTNIPSRLSLTDFRSAADRGGSFARGCRFIVVIRPPQAIKSYPKDLYYMCETSELPGRGFSVAQSRYYGPQQVFPVNTEYQPLNVTLLCRNDCSERRFLDDWQNYINPTSNFNYQYPNNYYAEIDIYQYTEYGAGAMGNSMAGVGQSAREWKPNVSYHWRLMKAWPTLVNAQPVNWAEQDVLRLQVTFAYKYWDRPNLIGSNGDSTGSGGTPVASGDTNNTPTLDTNLSFA